QMRISIPEEIEKAARILAQRDRIIAQANEEAARIVQLARERSDQLIDREAMVQAAQARAASIIEQARREADEISADANEYVIESLSELEETLLKALQVVRNGINKVTSDSSSTAATSAAAPLPVTIPVNRPTVEVSAGVAPRKDSE
ncbi:MAG: hypothetical protein NZM00_14545, partial [Anaerolinea sp.]|nr:hypothetical protein [Anaerolinea sp.]